jgi:hypothetical protein
VNGATLTLPLMPRALLFVSVGMTLVAPTSVLLMPPRTPPYQYLPTLLSFPTPYFQEYRENRNRAATTIQSSYRGYRCSVLYKMMMYKMNKVRKEQNKAATQIGRIIRGFVAR